MIFFIQNMGKWTAALHKLFASRTGSESKDRTVCVRGPFGSPSQHFDRFDKVAFISGGIGATPFSSIAKFLNERISTSPPDIFLSQLHALLNRVEGDVQQSIESAYYLQRPGIHQFLSSLGAFRTSRFTTESSFATTVSTYSLEGTESTDTFLGNRCLTERDSSLSTMTLEQSFPAITSPSLVYMDSEDTRGNPAVEVSSEIERILDQKESQIGPWSSFFQSRRIVFICLVLSIAGLGITGTGAIFESSQFLLGRSIPGKHAWIAITSISVSAITTCLVACIHLQSLWVHGPIRSVWSLVEIIIVVIFGGGSSVLELHRFLSSGSGYVFETLFHYIFLPLITIILLARRILHCHEPNWDRRHGRRGAFQAGDISPTSVDFFWSVRSFSEDRWLRRELEHVRRTKRVRLHRFISRGNASEFSKRTSPSEREWTKLGRPDWEREITNLVLTARNDSTIGMFICGPSRMRREVERAAKKAQIYSFVRGLYLSGRVHAEGESGRGTMNESEAALLSRFGCRVGIVLHYEPSP